MIKKILKSIFLLFPPVKKLYQDRNEYATDISRLMEENDNLKTEIKSLNQKINDLSTKIEQEQNDLSTKIEQEELDIADSLSDRGLFIVGHARSGTSVLLDALNSSKDVYCLGEANIHMSIEREGKNFCSWYNEMHRRVLKQPVLSRSLYLPEFNDKSGWQVLKILSKSYQYIGEKVAFRQEEMGYDYESFFSFSAKYFQNSVFICVIRNPEAVTISNVKMFMSGEVHEDTIKQVAISQMQIYYLILSIYLTFSKVFVLSHEDITQDTFDYLGKSIGIDLEKAGSNYDVTYQSLKKDTQDKSIVNNQQGLNSAVFNSNQWFCKVDSFYQQIVDLFDQSTLQSTSIFKVRRIAGTIYKELDQIGCWPHIKI